jgi:tetratricopeptide (TPR) repeat protein
VKSPWPLVIALQLLGNCNQYYLGDPERALGHHERALALAKSSAEKGLIALQLANFGEALQGNGHSERARAAFEEGLALASEAGDLWVAALSLGNLGSLELLSGDAKRAAIHFAGSIAARRELRDKRGLAGCLEGTAIVAQLTGRIEAAARLFGAAEAQRETIGASLTFVLTREDCDRSIDAVRGALAPSSFYALWKDGRAMTLDQAIDCALDLLSPSGEA